MKRELMFRCWDKEIKVMKSWEDISMGTTQPIGYFFTRHDFEIMQFTGLLDKNGVRIYEGDILQLHCSTEDGVIEKTKIKASVEWNEDRFIVNIPDKIVKVIGGASNGKMLSWREIHSWTGMHTCLTQWQSKLEVIGNIYENPELIK